MNSRMKYNISDLRELSECKSNTSSNLHLEVNVFTSDPALFGVQVIVEHTVLGVLAAIMVNPSGTIIEHPEDVLILTVDQVLSYLKMFGFDITYSPAEKLSEQTLNFLSSLAGLGFNMIRVLSVETPTHGFVSYPVAFNSEMLSEWALPKFRCLQGHFYAVCASGDAIRLDTKASGQPDWSWLTAPANINNILRANGR